MKLTHAKPLATATSLAALMFFVGYAPKTSAATPKHEAPAPTITNVHYENDALDFDLVNATGYEIKQVLISRSSQSEWNDDDDVLQGRAFPDGTVLHITFSPRTHAEHWDIRVTYSIDNTYKEFDNLNLTSISKVTLHWDGNHTSADIE